MQEFVAPMMDTALVNNVLHMKTQKWEENPCK